MSDYISAKCFACGAVVRAPISFGGRQSKCPQCQAIMTIPSPADTAELVRDEQLQEVAMGTVVADEDEAPIPPLPPGETATEDVDAPDLPPPPPPPGQPDTRRRTRPGGTMRRSRGAGRGRAGGKGGGGGGAGSRSSWPRQRPVKRKSSSTGLVITLVAVVVIILLIVIIVATQSSPAPEPGTSSGGAANPGTTAGTNGGAPATPATPPPMGTVNPQLQAACTSYLDAINRGNIAEAAAFHDQSDSPTVKGGIVSLIEQGTTYKNLQFTTADPGTGAVVFTCTFSSNAAGTQAGKQVTMSWKQGDDGSWKVVSGP